MREERRLHRMQHVALRHALERGDMRAVMTERESEARNDPPATHRHRTHTTLPAVAAFLGAGQVKPAAQEIEQRDPWIIQRETRVSLISCFDVSSTQTTGYCGSCGR